MKPLVSSGEAKITSAQIALIPATVSAGAESLHLMVAS